RSPDTKIATFC
ncbi:catalase family protein, partial [Vibrio parahaemolyticus V-223/04]